MTGMLAVAGLALAMGPVIGGLLVDIDNWRTVFWFNLVFGLILLVLSAKVLPESSDPQPDRLDFAGVALGAVVLASAAFAVIEGETAIEDA